jgi:hypothetical protein
MSTLTSPQTRRTTQHTAHLHTDPGYSIPIARQGVPIGAYRAMGKSLWGVAPTNKRLLMASFGLGLMFTSFVVVFTVLLPDPAIKKWSMIACLVLIPVVALGLPERLLGGSRWVNLLTGTAVLLTVAPGAYSFTSVFGIWGSLLDLLAYSAIAYAVARCVLPDGCLRKVR